MGKKIAHVGWGGVPDLLHRLPTSSRPRRSSSRSALASWTSPRASATSSPTSSLNLNLWSPRSPAPAKTQTTRVQNHHQSAVPSRSPRLPGDSYAEVVEFDDFEFAALGANQAGVGFDRVDLIATREPSDLVRRYLFPTEKFRGEWRRHWIQLVKRLSIGVLATFVLGYLAGYFAKQEHPDGAHGPCAGVDRCHGLGALGRRRVVLRPLHPHQ